MKIYALDVSLNGCAHTILDDGRVVFSERINTEGMVGFDRVEKIVSRIEAILDHPPIPDVLATDLNASPVAGAVAPFHFDVVVMENYAFTARTNNITKLAEVGGCIKRALFQRGYATGRDAILRGVPVFFTQTQGQMKKFCLANGAMKKDSRYLLEVMERIKISFKNDDEADAYMHAYTASIVVAVIRGKCEISNLTSYQQEALLERGVKNRKGLSMNKAKKLPDAEKLKIAMEMEVRS